MKNILLILLSVLLNAAAQILMRYGMLRVGEISLTQSMIVVLPKMIRNIFLWFAMLGYGISVVIWMIVLSRVEISYAYIFSSLGFVLVSVMSALILNEQLSAQRIAGIAVVCTGIIILARG
ncbi:MAG: 4-amino-4-deoxy-L-arabinose transferase [Spirochaetaceae bacterium]|jgi:multidrug transporter EmrE-like cation transporter|nr:4-amino-4-deoxy-L-arabinose transferase [Spirochaetaceae bacterium]